MCNLEVVDALPASYGRKSILNTLPGSYGSKSMRHLAVVDASQCVTWSLWTQLNARDASQWAIWLLWTHVNASPDC